MLIDTHCHLDFPEFNQDRAAVIGRAIEAGVGYIVNIGSSLKGSRDSTELASKFDCVYAAVGLHPHEADSFNKGTEEELASLAQKKKVVAIGEIGLDYFKNYSRKENQRALFSSLLEVAKKLGLPVVIHCRQAQDEILKALKKAMPIKAVVHCFSGDETFLRECSDLGLYLSFTCNITYKKADNLRELVKKASLDKLFLETDAPFLSPESARGKRNEPASVKVLADEIARLKGISFEEVASCTTANARDFFKLK